MKNGSTGLFNTLTLVFLLLTLFIFICALGMFTRIIQPPGAIAPKTQSVPRLLPTLPPSGALLQLPDGTQLVIAEAMHAIIRVSGSDA